MDAKFEPGNVTDLTSVITMKTTPVLRPLLGLTDDDPEAFSLTTDHNLGGKFQLPYRLQATSRSLGTQTKSNECVTNLVGVMPASLWKGPVILTRFYKLSSTHWNGDNELGTPQLEILDGSSIVLGESEQDEDMTLADLSHAMGLLEAAPVAELEADNRGA
jgi:hypothetical protein